MKRREEKLLSSDNKELFARYWEAEKPKYNLIIIHGFAEHSGRYDQFASDLTKDGISSFSFDLRGHGKSQGERGFIKNFNEFYDDISMFTERIRNSRGALPLFLFGHSLGGLLAFRFKQLKKSDEIKGVILSSPLFGLAINDPKFKKVMVPAMKLLAPRITLYNEVDPTLLSHDRRVVDDYIKDPLVHNRASAPFFYGLFDEMGKALQKAPMWQNPLLVQYADEDKIVDISAIEKLCSVIAPKWITKIKYNGFYHEIFNEVDKKVPLQDLKGWINSRVAVQAGAGHRQIPPSV